MATIGKLLVKLGLDSRGLESGEKKARRTLYNFDRTTRSVSKGITKSLGSIALSLGGAFAVGSAIKSSIRTIGNFEQSIADLASITGKPIKGMERLSKNAQDLGSVSAFTASEIVGLQTELAKLGFNENEIIASTKAIGDFSIAVGTDAASAAKLAGAVLRSFGKDAEEAESVVSTLAVATTKSALDFDKLNTSIAIVGPIARASGVGIERITALIGVLANNGVDASTAGTSLRNIFIKLSQKGITYSDAMEKINKSTNKVATATELFDVRSATAAITLARSSTELDKLEKSITGVDGALKEMTDKRLNTLQGQTTLLNSAWEGLILTIDQGNGVISNSLKFVVDGASGILTAFTELNKGSLGLKNFLLLAFGDKELRDIVIDDLKELRELKGDILDIREDSFFEAESKKTKLLKRRELLTRNIRELENRDTSGLLSFIKDPARDASIKGYRDSIEEINKELEVYAEKSQSLGKKIISSSSFGRIGGLDDVDTQIKNITVQVDGYKKTIADLDEKIKLGISVDQGEYNQAKEDLSFVQKRLIELQTSSGKGLSELQKSINSLSYKELTESRSVLVSALTKEFEDKGIENAAKSASAYIKTQIDLKREVGNTKKELTGFAKFYDDALKKVSENSAAEKIKKDISDISFGLRFAFSGLPGFTVPGFDRFVGDVKKLEDTKVNIDFTDISKVEQLLKETTKGYVVDFGFNVDDTGLKNADQLISNIDTDKSILFNTNTTGLNEARTSIDAIPLEKSIFIDVKNNASTSITDISKIPTEDKTITFTTLSDGVFDVTNEINSIPSEKGLFINAESNIGEAVRIINGLQTEKTVLFSAETKGIKETNTLIESVPVNKNIFIDVKNNASTSISDINKIPTENKEIEFITVAKGVFNVTDSINRIPLEKSIFINATSNISESDEQINALTTDKTFLLNAQTIGLNEARTSIEDIPLEKNLLINVNNNIDQSITSLNKIPESKTVLINTETTGIDNTRTLIKNIPSEKSLSINVVNNVGESITDINKIPTNKTVLIETKTTGIERVLDLIKGLPKKVISNYILNKPDVSPVFDTLALIPGFLPISIGFTITENALDQYDTIIDKIKERARIPLVQLPELDKKNTFTTETKTTELTQFVSEGMGRQNEGILKKRKEDNDAYNQSLALTESALASIGLSMNAQGEAVANLGNAILSGSDAFATFAQEGIKNIGDLANAVLKAGIAIVKSLIREGIAAAVANAFKNPAGIIPPLGLALAAGAGAAAASLFSGLIGPPPKLAAGGIAIGEQLAIVGDNPSGREAIIPLEKLPRMIGEMTGGNSELHSYLRNGHIYLANQQAAVNYGRRWG